MYGSNHEGVNWNKGSKKASKQKVEKRNRCNAVSCQQSCRYRPILTTVVTRGPRERSNYLQEEECDCPPSAATTVTTTTQRSRCLLTSLSSSDAKLVGVVITYIQTEYMPNFTSAGTPPHPPQSTSASASTKQTVGHE